MVRLTAFNSDGFTVGNQSWIIKLIIIVILM